MKIQYVLSFCISGSIITFSFNVNRTDPVSSVIVLFALMVIVFGSIGFILAEVSEMIEKIKDGGE